MRRLITDPQTGRLLDYGRKTYAIPDALREFLAARDKTCRHPGCAPSRPRATTEPSGFRSAKARQGLPP